MNPSKNSYFVCSSDEAFDKNGDMILPSLYKNEQEFNDSQYEFVEVTREHVEWCIGKIDAALDSRISEHRAYLLDEERFIYMIYDVVSNKFYFFKSLV